MSRLSISFFLFFVLCLDFRCTYGQAAFLEWVPKAKTEDSLKVAEAYYQAIQNDTDPREIVEIRLELSKYLQSKLALFDSSKALVRGVIEHCRQVNDTLGRANATLVLADFYLNEDNIPQTLKLKHEAHELFSALSDSMKIYKSLAGIAISHDYLGDHDAAIEYYQQCVEICQDIDHQIGVACMYHNLGGIYSDEEDFDQALQFYDQAEVITIKENDVDLRASIYQGRYLTYMRMELTSEAYKNLQLQKKYALMSGIPRNMAFSYQDQSSYFLKTENYDSSIYFGEKALQLAQELNNAQITTNAYQYLRQAYYGRGDYKNAYDYYELERKMNDSLFNAENSRIIESIQTEFETEKKERALAEKNLELQAASYKLQRRTTAQILLIIGLVVVFVMLFLIFRAYRLRKRANVLLAQRNAEVEAHNKEIQAMNETKNRWFINVAHELRTPLTLIKGPVQRLISQNKLSDEIEEDLQMVNRNTLELVKLVNELLDLSKLENGEMTLDEKVVDLDELVSQIITLFEKRATNQGVSISTHSKVKCFVIADQNKLFKVLVNLLSNAIKYTPSGGQIRIACEIADGVVLSVADTGRGIPAEDLPRIFNRFYQASNSENVGGTGVGLALASEIAELHGGEMRVKSELGKGTTFSLVLPNSRITEGTAVNEVVDAEYAMEDNFTSFDLLARLNRKPEVLVVEDNVDMRAYISSLLKPYFNVVGAGNGREGLQQLSENSIKLIISDMMMPEMDGLSFSKKVKSNENWKNIPFIYLSAITEGERRKEALRVGIDDYLQKPFDPEELMIRVQNVYMNAMSRMEAQMETEEMSYEDKVLQKLKTEVLEHISDSNFNVLRLADSAAMSERQIYRYLKSVTGLTPLQFIQEIKLNRAMELAQNRVYMTTGELAHAVGFRQSPYFSTLFEKRFGKKPLEYLRAG